MITKTDGAGFDETGLVLAASIEPLREAIVALATTARAARDAVGGMPAADSPAMRELECEDKYTSPETDEPFNNANSFSASYFFVAEDQLLDICALLTPQAGTTNWRPPVYGPTTLGRSVLETAARAAYLAEPGISYVNRAARGAAERLYSAEQQKAASPTDENRALVRELKADLAAWNTKWTGELSPSAADDEDADAPEPVVLDVIRPGNRQVVRRLLDHDDSNLGHIAYAYYCGVSHGVFWATSQSIDREVVLGASPIAADRHAIVVKSQHLAGALQVPALGYVLALEAVCTHRGWIIPELPDLWRAVADANPSLGE